MDNLLHRHKSSKLVHEEIDNPIFTKRTECVRKHFSTINALCPNDFTGEFHKTSKN